MTHVQFRLTTTCKRKLVFRDPGKMSLAWFLTKKNILRENTLNNIDIKRVPREVRRVPNIRTSWFSSVLILILVFPVPHHTACFCLSMSLEISFLVVPMSTTVPTSLVVLSSVVFGMESLDSVPIHGFLVVDSRPTSLGNLNINFVTIVPSEVFFLSVESTL